jgi:isopentenyl diphosphate isomerase/L-lactate dehydrogenase-like FMN-dependent dehydrogenase
MPSFTPPGESQATHAAQAQRPVIPAMDVYDVADLREQARRRLPKGLFDFIDRGNDDEVAMRENQAALARIKLRPRVLADVSVRDQSIELFGKRQQMPVAIGPTGSAGLAWYQGEIELAKAAAAQGIPYTMATGSMTAMERVVEEAGGTLWFQLYMWPERDLSFQLVERARAAGFDALVFTVDTPVAPGREYNLRNGFVIPFRFTRRNVVDVAMHPRWLLGVIVRYLLTGGLPRYENFPRHLQTRFTALPMGRSMATNPSMSWDDVRALRRLWPRTLIVKGIQHAEDARLAADCGVDGIVVSNHGGRVLDSAPAPIETLPSVLDAVGNRMTVLVDSGFRRGADVVKALAMGAHAILLGRAPLYGTAMAGQLGAMRAIQLYRDEIDRVLGLIGCRGIGELGPQHLAMPWDVEPPRRSTDAGDPR